MTFSTGARLGPYEVVSLVGSGGSASARLTIPLRELRRDLAEAVFARMLC